MQEYVQTQTMLEHLELEFLGLHSGYIDGCAVATRAVF